MTLVMATDFSPEAQRAGAIAAGMAARAEETLHLVHVSTDPRASAVLKTSEEYLLAAERQALAEAASALQASEGVFPRLLVEDRFGVPNAPRVIVAATDLSPLGDAAVPLAYGLVASGGTVHLVHVADERPFVHLHERAPKADLVTRLAERIPPDASSKSVRTECHIVYGRAADEIVALAERVGAVAICVGSRGRSGASAVLGSVSQEVIARSRCPVTVVPGPRE